MRVVLTDEAEQQLDEIYRFIAARSYKERAAAYVGRILAQCARLEHFPERGTRRDDIRPGLRTIGFERRVTIGFTVEPDAVVIHGILYGGQDIEAALGEPDEG